MINKLMAAVNKSFSIFFLYLSFTVTLIAVQISFLKKNLCRMVKRFKAFSD